MEKLGRILLFFLNVCVNAFLILLIIFLLFWTINGTPPKESLKTILTWIEGVGHRLTGTTAITEQPTLGQKQYEKAKENMYIEKDVLKEENPE